MTRLLQASLRLPHLQKVRLWSPLRTPAGARRLNVKMSTSSSPLAHSVTLPAQPDQPVEIVAAPGVSDSDLRHVGFFPFLLKLVKKIYVYVWDQTGVQSIRLCSSSG